MERKKEENKKSSGSQSSESANNSESEPSGNESRSSHESSVGENPASDGELKDEGVIGNPQLRALSEEVARLNRELEKLEKEVEEKDLLEQLLAEAEQKIETLQEEIEDLMAAEQMRNRDTETAIESWKREKDSLERELAVLNAAIQKVDAERQSMNAGQAGHGVAATPEMHCDRAERGK